MSLIKSVINLSIYEMSLEKNNLKMGDRYNILSQMEHLQVYIVLNMIQLSIQVYMYVKKNLIQLYLYYVFKPGKKLKNDGR